MSATAQRSFQVFFLSSLAVAIQPQFSEVTNSSIHQFCAHFTDTLRRSYNAYGSEGHCDQGLTPSGRVRGAYLHWAAFSTEARNALSAVRKSARTVASTTAVCSPLPAAAVDLQTSPAARPTTPPIGFAYSAKSNCKWRTLVIR